MKICIICSNSVGGFKSFVENVSRILNKNNIETTILHINHSDGFICDSISGAYIERKNKRTLFLISYLSLLFLRRCAKKFYCILHKKDREAILSYNVFGAQRIAATNVLKIRHVINLTAYDCVISSEEVFCNYFLANNVIAKKKIGYVHPDYLMAHFDRAIDTFFFKNLDFICAVSRANYNSMLKVFPRFAKKLRGIRNPIDVDLILKKADEPKSETFEKNLINIVTVCRLDNSSKALDRLLLLVAKLKQNGFVFFWRIIGEGPYRESMEERIKEYDIADRVKMLGYIDNPLPYVKESSLFVLQSYYEGYPISVCESLIVNTPALITDFPSCRELIDNFKTGFIVQNNFDSIYGCLSNLLNDKNSLEAMKNNLYSIDKSYFENVDLLLELL